MPSRRPVPPSLTEPNSVDPSPAVLAALTAALQVQRNERMLRLEWQHLADPEAADRTMVTMAYDLYDARLAWMGPGADPAFLDFYLLAEARLPPMVRSADYHWTANQSRWFDDRNGPLDGHLLAIGLMENGFRPTAAVSVNGVKRSDRQLAIARGKVLREVHKRTLDAVWQTVVFPTTTIHLRYDDKKPAPVWYDVLWAPSPSFRTDLMGELAFPWPNPKDLPTTFLSPPRVVRRP